MLPGIISFPAGQQLPIGITELFVSSTDVVTPASYASVPLGDDNADRRIVVLAWHGDTATVPGTTPTCSVGATSMTRIFADTTGNGAGPAVGVSMFVGNPTGTSDTVTVTWGGAGLVYVRITVLNLIGYSSTVVASGAEAATGSNGQISISTAAGGCIIGMAGDGLTSGDQTWTNISKRGTVADLGNRRTWAWDMNTTGSAVNAIVTPWVITQGGNAMGVASFPLL